MHKIRDRKNIDHLAGIVPVASKPLDFKMPWNDALMPIAQDFLAVERAVYECALAGCETIWIVCHYGIEPLIKKRLGEFITDPVSLTTGLNPSLKRRDIGIYYVPVSPKDREKRDSLAWSVLYGADTAFRVSAYISKWIIPEKFYCSFPYNITEDEIIWKNRKKINSTEKIFFSYNGKSVKDGLHINFTFNQEDYKLCKQMFSKKELENWKKENNFNLEYIFQQLNFEEKNAINLPWHYDISSWEKYKIFLSSKESSCMKKNNVCFIKEKRRNFASQEEGDMYCKLNKKNAVIDPDYLE